MSLVEVSKAFPPVKDFLASGKKKARRQAHRVGMNANNKFQAVKPFVNKYPTMTAAGLIGAGVAAGGAGGYMMSKSDSLVELSKKLSPEKLAQAKARAKRNGRPYPNAYDNMIAGGAKFNKSDSLVDLSKDWKGEKGDKRNTKYAAAAGGGGLALAAGMAQIPSYRRIDRIAMKRGNRAMAGAVTRYKNVRNLGESSKRANLSGGPPAFKDMLRANVKGQFSTPGYKRKEIVRSVGAIAGAGAGAGALAAYRRNKANNEVTKAGPMRGSSGMTRIMQSEADRKPGSPRNNVARLRSKNKKAGMSALLGPRTFIPKV